MLLRRVADRVKSVVLTQLRLGITPEKLALSIALGLCLGLFPVIGTTTLLCAAAALALRLNQPMIQVVNYLAAPLQLLALLPLLQLGARLFGAEPLPLGLDEIRALVATSPSSAWRLLGAATLRGIVAWLVLAPVVAASAYVVSWSVLRRMRWLGRTPLP